MTFLFGIVFGIFLSFGSLALYSIFDSEFAESFSKLIQRAHARMTRPPRTANFRLLEHEKVQGDIVLTVDVGGGTVRKFRGPIVWRDAKTAKHLAEDISDWCTLKAKNIEWGNAV